ncbi:TraR/DksA C4-type zinc finger protein [Paenibacillus sp. YPG26]|uniref:TraR/DksA C4-type zinc finger protein n=1 Tax=Paenibacillus sp. YPG26 TaxID=2878915 RepID=UPI00203E7EA5|nr:TraR/DksA C4-type zinc finger protein [Paenibacillus sp. YPG26]USB34519.1 TraR/DksA family transcriptional regulator [Paenibacillus sp. YPG26]
MSHLSNEQISTLQQRLREQREDISSRLAYNEHYGMAATTRENISELSTNDNHPGDLGTEVFERGKDLALAEHDELHLDRIDDALQRMNEGSYGVCITCGQPISYDRLEAIPETTYCIEHTPQREVSSKRPIEEEFLYPPFGRTSMDEHDDQNGFDGEDAWQILESYGTSNSPAMAEGNEIDNYNDMEIEADNELDGFVEPYESFVATDITGTEVFFYRNGQYRKHMSSTRHLESEESLGTGSNEY